MNANKIITIVEQYHNLPNGSIKRRKRTKTAVEARKQAVVLSRQYTKNSWAELEEIFDRKFMRGIQNVKIPFGLKWKMFMGRFI